MIKRSPADFQVEEILRTDLLDAPPTVARVSGAPESAAESPAPRHLLCRLTKESLSTPEAAARIARELKLKPGAVAYAGLKDKHASTVQYVTVKLDEGATPPANVAGTGWKLENLDREVSRSIQSSDIDCNQFKIVARNLTDQDAFDMDEAADLLS